MNHIATAFLLLLALALPAHAIAHNKVMVLDGKTVITGSFNFTKAAEEKSAENVLIVRDKVLARLYRENWEAHRGHSEES